MRYPKLCFALGISNNNQSFHNMVHFVVFHQTSDLIVVIVNNIKVFFHIFLLEVGLQGLVPFLELLMPGCSVNKHIDDNFICIDKKIRRKNLTKEAQC